jgi:hypothetical protein
MTDMQIDEKSSTFKIILKRIKDFILVPPSPAESIFQYTIRQFLIPDSDGKPSITITIASIIAAACIYIVTIASHIALTPIRKYDPTTGKLIYEGLTGFTPEFYIFAMTLFGAVMYLYKKRQQNKAEEAKDDTSDVDINSLAAKVMELINKVKPKG